MVKVTIEALNRLNAVRLKNGAAPWTLAEFQARVDEMEARHMTRKRSYGRIDEILPYKPRQKFEPKDLNG